jgi:hypothetical protein
MVRPLRFVVAAVTALFLAPALDAAQQATIAEIRIGLADGYKLGHWTPVWVTIEAGEQPLQGRLQVTTPDGDDVPATFTGGQLDNLRIAAAGSRTVIAYVRIGRRDSRVRLQFIHDARDAGISPLSTTLRADDKSHALLASQQRVLVVGAAVDMEQATRFLPRNVGEEIVSARVVDPSSLPDRWYGYDGVDALVLTSSDTAFYDQLTDTQQQALIEWVQQGGRAILSVGKHGEEALRSGSFLSQLAPGRFLRTAPLRETATLESFIDAQVRLDLPLEGQPPSPLQMTQLGDIHGEVILSGGAGRPLLVRAPLGFGEVLFVAFDLDQPPIAQWPDRGRLISKLLEALWRNVAPSDEQHRGGQVSHLGFADLTGQLTAALDQFHGVRLIPFSWVAGLIVLYIVLIGPADYFLLRRYGRMEFTWLTFSLVVLALGATAWWLAGWARGTTVRLNQVDIVDVDVSTSRMRGTTWLRIYSPRNQDFQLQLAPTTPALSQGEQGLLLAWQGLPGRSLSGMDASSHADLEAQRYLIRDAAAQSDMPWLEVDELSLSVGTTKGFVARWWGKSALQQDFTPLKSSALKLVSGRVVNPLNVRLEGCVLYHDRWAYKLGTLEAGQGVSLDDTASPLDVKWLLTQRTVVDSRDVTRPWDRSMRDDVPRILEMLMFHETAGGRGYTGLMHRYDQFIDLSGQLTAGRAVLVGRADDSATRLLANNQHVSGEQDRHWTYYRIVLPTTPERTAP